MPHFLLAFCSVLFYLHVSKKLRAKMGRTMVGLCGGKGIAILAEAVTLREQSSGKILQPAVLLVCRAKASCAKKPLY